MRGHGGGGLFLVVGEFANEGEYLRNVGGSGGADEHAQWDSRVAAIQKDKTAREPGAQLLENACMLMLLRS
jgi:trehalose-6-phosphatase